jgi:hypothetical protein
VNDELEIRKRFASMRNEDSSRISRFEHVLERVRTKSYLGLRPLVAASCLLIATIVVSVAYRSYERVPATSGIAAPSLAHWRAPTDFLLDTPGRELLYAIPQIGEASSDELKVFPNQEPPS